MGNEIVEQLATCGERITEPSQLCRRTRWVLAYDSDGSLSEIGRDLLQVLAGIHNEHDDREAAEQEHRANQPPLTAPIPVAQFYSTSSRPRPRPRPLPRRQLSPADDVIMNDNSQSSEEEPLCIKYPARRTQPLE